MIIEKKDTNILKAVAILLVIFGHLGILRFGTWESGIFGVSIFLVLSGYGIQKSFEKNGLNKYWRKKFERIYIPYILVVIIQIIVDSIFGEAYSVQEIVLSILCKGDVVDGTLWYIFYLFMFYFAFWLICVLNKNRYCVNLLLLAGIIYAIMYVIGIYNAPVVTPIYFPFFAIGVFLAQNEVNLSKKTSVCLMIIGASLSLGIIVASKVFDNTLVASISGMISVYPFTLFFFVLYNYICMVRVNMKRERLNCLTCIGEYSYILYLFEGILISKYRIYVDNFFFEIVIYFIVLASFSFVYKKLIDFCLKIVSKVRSE